MTDSTLQNAATERLLDTRIQQATEAVENSGQECMVLALPDDFELHDITHLLPQRPHYKCTFSSQCLADYCGYVESFANHYDANNKPLVCVDADDMSAKAVIDIGNPSEPGHCLHSANLNLPITAAFSSYLSATRSRTTQQEIVLFAEEYQDYVTFVDAEKEVIPFETALKTLRAINVKKERDTESEVGEFSAAGTAKETVSASSKEGKIPAFVRFKCVPYLELSERTFFGRITLNTEDVPATFRINRMRHEIAKEEMAAEFAALIREGITDSTVYQGTVLT